MSWLTQFWGWLNTPAVSRQDRPDGKLNAPEKDGLSQAKAVLAAEQMQLADELERLFQAYDEKVQNLALRVRQLPAGAAEAEIRRLRAIQHELDHLQGKVFVEYLSQLKQGRIKNKLKKRLRETM